MIGLKANRLDSDSLISDGQTDRRTFAILESLSRLIIQKKQVFMVCPTLHGGRWVWKEGVKESVEVGCWDAQMALNFFENCSYSQT